MCRIIYPSSTFIHFLFDFRSIISRRRIVINSSIYRSEILLNIIQMSVHTSRSIATCFLSSNQKNSVKIFIIFKSVFFILNSLFNNLLHLSSRRSRKSTIEHIWQHISCIFSVINVSRLAVS